MRRIVHESIRDRCHDLSPASLSSAPKFRGSRQQCARRESRGALCTKEKHRITVTDADLEGARDFDFLVGNWSVLHRRLKRRLAEDTEWLEFTGPASVRHILDGIGNIDEIRVNLPSGPSVGATLRLFNPATQLWSIYWMDSRTPGAIDPPMVGRFRDGRSLFFGDNTLEGRPIRIRFHLDADFVE